MNNVITKTKNIKTSFPLFLTNAHNSDSPGIFLNSVECIKSGNL